MEKQENRVLIIPETKLIQVLFSEQKVSSLPSSDFSGNLKLKKMGQVAPDEISFFNLKAIQWQKAPRPNTLIYVECCDNSTLGP